MNRTTFTPHRVRRASLAAVAVVVVAGAVVAAEKIYTPADETQRPQSSKTEILPERFLRGYDPITVYFVDNVGPAAHAPADDASRFAKV
jgi:hypothetical protein